VTEPAAEGASSAESGAVVAELSGPARPLTIEEMAFVLGGFRFVELSAFERLGRLASEERSLEPAVVTFASAASMAHAWRAAQLEELLPVSVGLPGVDECTRPQGPQSRHFVAELSLEGAASWYRTLAAAYRRRAGHAHPSADGPIIRVLRRLEADILAVAGDIGPSPAAGGP
jgi:hypothetical protein